MAALPLNRCFLHKNPTTCLQKSEKRRSSSSSIFLPATPRPHRRRPSLRASAGSRADDPLPFEMSLERALKLLGVPHGASFDEVVRAKNRIVASCDGDLQAIAQVEAAYDMLLMQSFTQRMAGKVVNSSIRYADVKPVKTSGTGALPQWVQSAAKSPPVSVESPSIQELGIKAGVYGALAVFTYASGASTSSTGTYSGADVPGIILATSLGASLYFLTKKGTGVGCICYMDLFYSMKNSGKATLITVGGLIVGAVVGSAVEQWLQVDIVPFFGIHSPAVIVSEFILFSQFLVSLYLR